MYPSEHEKTASECFGVVLTFFSIDHKHHRTIAKPKAEEATQSPFAFVKNILMKFGLTELFHTTSVKENSCMY